ncbi:MAG TPA: ATP-dependent protease ATPase subunit HslU [Candidatus Dormibacteraeota bacterium]|nr:ATP-dependent protease ATPase subunit HslU [Candidatus Dormibacteraeota bacterium]
MRPVEIVRRLDEYIIGQSDAKRAVAIALRNRMRRQRLAEDMRDEVLPKNILMIGPTGVGKTEIARRLARLTSSPFIKVEATKFTEVGYVGRDVESIIRDLLEQTITDFHNDRVEEVEEKAREIAEERIVDSLIDVEEKQRRAETSSAQQQPQQSAPSAEATPEPPQPQAAPEQQPQAATSEPTEEQRHRRRLRRRQLLRKLRRKQLEDREIEVEVEEPYQPVMETFSGTGMEEVGFAITDFFTQMTPPRKRMRRMTVADARNVLTQEETDRLVDMDRVYDDAIKAVEDDGIVFVDEVDKIAGGRSSEHGPDVSGEGVQRDLLPLVEGSTVHTRYGAVHTDHILFVSAGAFNVAKPSDLIPEFQGRFPIRVELKPLTEDDLQRILVEPSNALTKQYVALLATEGVTLEFSDDGLRELAHQAHAVNDQDENIGARRLFTIMEKVLEDVSFSAEEHAGQTVTVDAAYVRRRLSDLVRNEDLRRYVL